MDVKRIARSLGWLGTAAILALSLVPGTLRPHVVEFGHAEHFAAYLATGLCFSFGARSHSERAAAFVSFAILSGLVEIAQLWIPGRTGEWGGFLFSSAGALTGTLAGLAVAKVAPRPAEG